VTVREQNIPGAGVILVCGAGFFSIGAGTTTVR